MELEEHELNEDGREVVAEPPVSPKDILPSRQVETQFRHPALLSVFGRPTSFSLRDRQTRERPRKPAVRSESERNPLGRAPRSKFTNHMDQSRLAYSSHAYHVSIIVQKSSAGNHDLTSSVCFRGLPLPGLTVKGLRHAIRRPILIRLIFCQSRHDLLQEPNRLRRETGILKVQLGHIWLLVSLVTITNSPCP